MLFGFFFNVVCVVLFGDFIYIEICRVSLVLCKKDLVLLEVEVVFC